MFLRSVLVREHRICGGPFAVRTVVLLSLATLAGPDVLSGAGGSSTQDVLSVHLQKAQRAARAGNFAEAEVEFRTILELDPRNTDARANLGVMLFFQSRWSEAAGQFRKALEERPSVWKVQALLGMCDRRLGQTADAMRLLAEAVPQLQDIPLQTEAGLELIEMLYQHRELDRAIDVIRILKRSAPSNADVLYTAARIYTDLANDASDVLIQTAPDSARTHRFVAQSLINSGDLQGALIQYRKALELDSRIRGVHLELAEAILRDSRSATSLDAAQNELQAALKEDPDDGNVEFWLGQLDAQRGNYQNAVRHYSRAVQLQPDYADAYLGLGVALIATNQPQKAQEHLLEAVRLDPLNPKPHYRLAVVYRKSGRESDAAEEIATFRKLRDEEKRVQEVYH
jgi:Tfp pilus assembly protein PilF